MTLKDKLDKINETAISIGVTTKITNRSVLTFQSTKAFHNTPINFHNVIKINIVNTKYIIFANT